MPTVRVEFFGMPRRQAGLAAIDVEVTSLTLGDVLAAAAMRVPGFAKHCLDGSRLKPGLLANISGRHFTTEPFAVLTAHDSVLILSSDVGGH